MKQMTRIILNPRSPLHERACRETPMRKEIEEGDPERAGQEHHAPDLPMLPSVEVSVRSPEADIGADSAAFRSVSRVVRTTVTACGFESDHRPRRSRRLRWGRDCGAGAP